MDSNNGNKKMLAYDKGEGMMKKLACDNCGAIIYRCPSKIKSYNIFCSPDCMNEYHKKMHKVIDKCNKDATIASGDK